MRRTGFKPRVRPLRRSRLIVKRSPDQVPKAMRLAVLVRDGYRCACCGEPLDLDRWECHHRQLRSQGGRHAMANLIALKPAHHRTAHRAGRQDAERRGLIVPAWADPTRIPVLRHGLRYEQPDDGWLPGHPAEWQVAA